jgi:hypothetical protein
MQRYLFNLHNTRVMYRDTMGAKQQPTVTRKAQPGMQESYIFGTDSQILLADFGYRWQWKTNPACRKATSSARIAKSCWQVLDVGGNGRSIRLTGMLHFRRKHHKTINGQ